MARYRTNGLTTATAATDAHAIAEIWNGSGTKRIYLVEIALNAITAPGAGAGIAMRRSTAKGTPAATVTPNAESSDERDAAPDSGFTLELGAFSVQPTLAAGELGLAWSLPAVAASGIVYPFSGRGLAIPPGTGLVLVNRAAIVMVASEISAVVDD
jgi:hypothetical protein